MTRVLPSPLFGDLFFRSKKFGLAILVLLIASKVLGQGGPPLVTDDPGTLKDGHWEINSVAQWTINNQSKVLQAPLFDINYGYSDHIQLNLNTGLKTVSESGGAQTSGLSVASVATKWRFTDEDLFGIAISTYPRVDFHHGLSSNDLSVNPPGTRYFLPIEFAKEFGRLGVNPEIGYASYTQSACEWVYGIAISYTFEKEKEALFEIHGRSLVGSPDHELLYNFGTRYIVANDMSLIASLGKTFVTYSGEPISWNLYMGLQIRL
ncbi:MAG: hypothetical protein ACXVCY_18995 [Pseudobdellovibrionaceae bacterium]